MSDTPRTDAAAIYGGDITVSDMDVVPADFARHLERELVAWEAFGRMYGMELNAAPQAKLGIEGSHDRGASTGPAGAAPDPWFGKRCVECVTDELWNECWVSGYCHRSPI